MEVVKHVSERYLWVDRYCINNDKNNQPKKQTIQSRDVALQLYQQQASSRMAASVYSDENTDELLVLLHERWKSS